MVAYNLIGDQRRAAQKRQSLMVSICLAGVLLACLVIAGNIDFAEALDKEQRTADTACRAAGANHAVKIDADGVPLYICNRPANASSVRRAVLRRVS